MTLQDPLRSWSGVRDLDGAVVFALSETDVRASADGFRCLLWTPVIDSEKPRMDGADKDERLRHCRLALLLGGADGLLVSPGASEVDAGAVLTLQVERRRNEYWALWGSTVRRTWMAGLAPSRAAALAA